MLVLITRVTRTVIRAESESDDAICTSGEKIAIVRRDIRQFAEDAPRLRGSVPRWKEENRVHNTLGASLSDSRADRLG